MNNHKYNRKVNNQKVQINQKPLGTLKLKPNRNEKKSPTKITEVSESKKLKNSLLKDLQKCSANIGTIPDEIDIYKDEIALNLLQIEKSAKKNGFQDIQKQVNHYLGKRLINLELQISTKEHKEKLKKRQKMQDQFYRHKQIKLFNYEELVANKLQQNSFIIKPYLNGKGFIESDIYENQYQCRYTQKLQDCGYIQVAKQANKIILNNFSYGSVYQIQILTKISILLTFILPIMMIAVITSSPERSIIIYFIYIISIGLFILISIVVFKSYINKPKGNNQMEQTLQDVKIYVNELNKKNKKYGKKFQWLIQEHLMYIQVHFEDSIHSL